MNIKTYVGCLAVLFLCGIPRAQAAPSWAHNGQWYLIVAPKDTPLLPDSTLSDGYASARVDIIETGSGEWARVEYDYVPVVSNSSTPVTIYKRRAWVNFAHVTNAVLTTEPDYKKEFPQGSKVIPYKGTNK